jgi:hypothetical protein
VVSIWAEPPDKVTRGAVQLCVSSCASTCSSSRASACAGSRLGTGTRDLGLAPEEDAADAEVSRRPRLADLARSRSLAAGGAASRGSVAECARSGICRHSGGVNALALALEVGEGLSCGAGMSVGEAAAAEP